MNANAATVNTDEKYAWVDALLENCALQEQREYEDVEEANPEWNQDGEDGEEGDYMEYCENCNAEFATDRQLGYHQMVCKPGSNLCDDFLDRPPSLRRQNACLLTLVVDELTGDMSLVETDAYDHMELDDLIADEIMEDNEDQDQVLYDLKRYNEITYAPFKRQKTYDEHESIPMEICDSDEDDDLEPCELFPDEDDDNLSVMTNIEVELVVDNDECNCDHDVDSNEVCYDCIWFLEQEDLHRFPRRARQEPIPVQAEDPFVDIIFPVFDNNGIIDPIPMDIDDLSDLPDLLTDAEIAQSLEDDLLEDYQANMCELYYLEEEALERGANLSIRNTERLAELRRSTAEYEMRQRT